MGSVYREIECNINDLLLFLGAVYYCLHLFVFRHVRSRYRRMKCKLRVDLA